MGAETSVLARAKLLTGMGAAGEAKEPTLNIVAAPRPKVSFNMSLSPCDDSIGSLELSTPPTWSTAALALM
jgi:hypothetical protein